MYTNPLLLTRQTPFDSPCLEKEMYLLSLFLNVKDHRSDTGILLWNMSIMNFWFISFYSFYIGSCPFGQKNLAPSAVAVFNKNQPKATEVRFAAFYTTFVSIKTKPWFGILHQQMLTN